MVVLVSGILGNSRPALTDNTVVLADSVPVEVLQGREKAPATGADEFAVLRGFEFPSVLTLLGSIHIAT
jgi:hypothetical protein